MPYPQEQLFVRVPVLLPRRFLTWTKKDDELSLSSFSGSLGPVLLVVYSLQTIRKEGRHRKHNELSDLKTRGGSGQAFKNFQYSQSGEVRGGGGCALLIINDN